MALPGPLRRRHDGARGTPRLIHWPEAPTPYTPPIPFYLMVCQLMGTAPAWTEGAAGGPGAVGARRRV